MTHKNIYWALGLLLLLASCKPDQPDPAESSTPTQVPERLPFTALSLDDFSGFKEQPDNWQIAGEVFVDRSAELKMESSPGNGILVNTTPPREGAQLFTAFEHGDIELELDVMIPRGSNSGIYFQGRYEIQVFDSWGVAEPQNVDMGGIYQRWDPSKPAGQNGYEGHAPAENASKSPGLWQHFRIVFHAPQFNAAGQKTKNAWFEEVWLNGVKLHENVSLNGPTRAAAFQDEVAMAPLMIQGDHGPVAFRNIKYKKYDAVQVEPKNMVITEYGNESIEIPDLSTLTAKSTGPTDSISYQATSSREKYILDYQGQLFIPNSGDYIFHLKSAQAAVTMIIGQDTVLKVGGRDGFGKDNRSIVHLEAGELPFQLIYNKHCCSWTRGFLLEIEGPGVQRQALTAEGSAFTGSTPEPIYVELEATPVFQRGFLMHHGEKLTHVISVGTPTGLHYSYDLERGALLQVWNGPFLDVTDMWHERGQRQLSKPRGSVINFHGEPNIFALGSATAAWPDTLQASQNFKPMGYELNDLGYPIFIYETNGVEVRNELIPSDADRKMTRKIALKEGKGLWLKIDEGSAIKELADGSYVVNDYKYFVELSAALKTSATIRASGGKQELLIELKPGTQTVQYDIIW